MNGTSSEPLVRFIDVRKSYDGKGDAVRALNLEVANGEFLTLLGPSGSGRPPPLSGRPAHAVSGKERAHHLL